MPLLRCGRGLYEYNERRKPQYSNQDPGYRVPGTRYVLPGYSGVLAIHLQPYRVPERKKSQHGIRNQKLINVDYMILFLSVHIKGSASRES